MHIHIINVWTSTFLCTVVEAVLTSACRVRCRTETMKLHGTLLSVGVTYSTKMHWVDPAQARAAPGVGHNAQEAGHHAGKRLTHTNEPNEA